jgi:hypothetical protein
MTTALLILSTPAASSRFRAAKKKQSRADDSSGAALGGADGGPTNVNGAATVNETDQRRTCRLLSRESSVPMSRTQRLGAATVNETNDDIADSRSSSCNGKRLPLIIFF